MLWRFLGVSALKNAVLMHPTLSVMLNRSGTMMGVCQNKRKGSRNYVMEILRCLP
jgi:hypothetical protein